MSTLKQRPLLGKVKLKATLVTKTGLQIGGSSETLDIGGIDKFIVRDPITFYPYIPGSSLKGKLRAISERLHNKTLNRNGGGNIYRYESDDLEDGFSLIGKNRNFIPFQGANTCPISRIFGSTGKKCLVNLEIARDQQLDFKPEENQNIEGIEYAAIVGRNRPANLIVRDSFLTDDSVTKLKKIDTGLYMTELKFENSIDRVTAAAQPRQFERVPKDAKFEVELVYTVDDKNYVCRDLRNLVVLFAILENDSLGGSGSRGYGKVEFINWSFEYLNLSDFSSRLTDFANFDWQDLAKFEGSTQDMLRQFNSFENELQEQLPSVSSTTLEGSDDSNG